MDGAAPAELLGVPVESIRWRTAWVKDQQLGGIS